MQFYGKKSAYYIQSFTGTEINCRPPRPHQSQNRYIRCKKKTKMHYEASN